MQITDICARLQSDKPGDVARSLIAQQIGQRIASPTREGAGKGGLRGVWRCESYGKQGRKRGGGTRDKWDGRLWAQQDYSLQKRSTASWTLGGGSLFRLAVAARNPGGNDKSVETGRGVALKWILEGGKSEKLKKELEDFTGGLKN